jgi:hypothetical protein
LERHFSSTLRQISRTSDAKIFILQTALGKKWGTVGTALREVKKELEEKKRGKKIEKVKCKKLVQFLVIACLGKFG